MSRSRYKIGVTRSGEKFVLMNHTETAGPRLVKGDTFPFTKARWWEYDDVNDAMKAAAQLQRYLEAQE